MGSIDELVRALAAFDGRKAVLRELRGEMARATPPVRRAIRRRALDTLPSTGGLAAWVARASVRSNVRATGRAVRISLRGSRKSLRDRSDLRAIDRGRVRHPSWGRRGAGQWHTQAVTAGYFTEPAAELDQWRAAALAAVDTALREIRG